MNILVIGGAGFIGSHLVEQLSALGHTVAVLDNLSAGKREYVPEGVKFYQVDILSPDLAQVFDEQKPAVVYHLAAQKNLRLSIDQPVFDAEINIMGSLKVLEQAARYGSRVVFSSSAAVYGNYNIASDEEGITKPVTPYGITKLAVEHYLQFYQQQHRLPIAIFRFANVYGPRQNPASEAGVIALFCQWVLENKPLKVNSDGLQTRDFVYVKDIVQALLYGLDHDGIYNVGTGVETSLQDIIRELSLLAQSKPVVEYQPAIIGEVSRFTFRTDKLRALGWQPETSVREGLRQTYNWLQSTQQLL